MKARLSTDGGARGNPGPAAFAYVLEGEDGTVLAAHGEAIGVATNNVAEYRALVEGLRKALELSVPEVEVVSDSELIVKQMTGEYRVKNEALRELSLEAARLARQVGKVQYRAVRREHNELADRLVNEALDAAEGGDEGGGAPVDVETAVRAWIDGYSRAWREHDAGAAAALYADDAVYRSHPFREPHLGRGGVLGYTRGAFAGEEGLEFWFGEPLASGDRAAVEYWATFTEDGREVTLAGCDVLRFRADGLCVEHRDYWALEDGRRPPPPGWAGADVPADRAL